MSKKRSIISLAIVIAFIVIFGYVGLFGLSLGRYDILPVSSAIRLGLDLRGGVYTVYQAVDTDVENFADKLNSTMEVLRARLDGKGYAEATITIQGTDSIRIEIPAVSDPEEVLGIIGTPALLEFVDPDGNVILTGSDVELAEAGYLSGEGNAPVVNFKLTAAGADTFAKETAEHLNEVIEIRLDGNVISDPQVNSVITGGEAYIEGVGTIEEAQELAMLIESGALPLELEQLEVRTVSPTLGEGALENCIIAGAIGIALLMVYLAVFYRLPGLISDLALLVYIIIVMYLLAIISSIQLTLPGIAGIILGIGMAVDANVIIFERIKEEMSIGKPITLSVESGFKRAFTAILDSNVTTIIAALVLMYFGTGTVKSFAYTLAISICVSFFTAVFVTRVLLRAIIGLKVRNPKLYQAITFKKKEASTDEV